MLIAAFLIWCFLRISVNIICEYNGSPAIAVRVLFVKIRIIPSKKKSARTKALSASAYRKKIKKYEDKLKKKEEKKALKKEKKEKQKAEKKRLKEEEKKTLTKEAKKLKRDELVETILFFAKVGGRLLRRFGSRLGINVKRLKITVASKDAASTAIMYGAITQASAYLFKVLERATRFRCKKEEFSIKADFCSEKLKADLCIVFKIRLWHVLALAFSFLGHFIKHKYRAYKKKKSQGSEGLSDISDNKNSTDNTKEKAVV